MNIITSFTAGADPKERGSIDVSGTQLISKGTRVLVLFVFMVAILCFSGRYASAQTYYSQGNLPVNELTSWNSAMGGGGTGPSSFTGTHGWIIQAGHDMTMTGNWTVGGTAAVTVGGSLTVTGSNRVIITGTMAVNGTLVNAGTYSAAAAAVTATSGITVTGTYQHARDGGYLPSATWNNGSTCLVTGWIAGTPLNTSFSQSFYNFSWNCPGQAADVSFGGFVSDVRGTFTLAGSGDYLVSPGGNALYGNFLQTGGTYTLSELYYNRTLDLSGNFTLEDGTFNLDGGRIGTVNIAGDLNVSGGSLNMNSENYRSQYINVGDDVTLTGGLLAMSNGTGVGFLNIAGDFSNTAGTVTADQVEGEIAFSGVFNGSAGMQTFTSGGVISGTVNFTVEPGAYLQMADEATVVEGDGLFLLTAGSTLGVTSADGIMLEGSPAGNIQTSVRAYLQGANYIYNGIAAQSAGDALTFEIPGNLAIRNTSGAVTLSTDTEISGVLAVSEGSVLDLAGYGLGVPGGINLEAGPAGGASISGTGILTAAGTVTVTSLAGSTDGAIISCPVNSADPLHFMVADIASVAADLTVSGPISGGGVIKEGAGTLILSASNSFTGELTITAGTVQYGSADALANTVPVTLAGGTLSTGAAAGYSDVAGVLSLSGNSTIVLGTGDHTLGFSNSSSVSWAPGAVVTVTGWSGTPGLSGSEGKISFGSSAGLTTTQLGQIRFLIGANYHPAVILASGEVVPNEHPYLYDVAITPSSPQSFCEGSSGTELTAAESGGGPIISRQWGKRSVSGGAVTPVAGATGQTFSPTSAEPGPGTWYLVCTSIPTYGDPITSNEVSVTTNLLPDAGIIAGGPVEFCSGGTVTLASAAPGNAVNLTAAPSYIEVDDYSGLNSANLTVEAWIYTTNNSYYKHIVFKGDHQYIIQLEDGMIDFGSRAASGAGYTELRGTTRLSTGRWYHVAVTHDGSVKRIYVNGVLEASQAQTGLYTGDQNSLVIGQHVNLNPEFQFYGYIDELRIWSVARTQAEIAATMNKEISPDFPNLTAYFRMNERSGTSALNSASPANSGTLVNGPSWGMPSTVPIPYTYLWSTGATTPEISAGETGLYQVTVTGTDGCESVGSQSVTVWAGGTWTGAAGTDWNDPANWCGGVPDETTNVVIPDFANDPVIGPDQSIDCNDLTVEAGAVLTVESGLTGSGSLIVHGDASGEVTYNRLLREGINTGDKHLLSSPVGGQSVPGFISDHSTKIDAVRLWDEVAAVWSPVTTPVFREGLGYNIQQTDASDGLFSFTGTVVSSASVTATSPYAMSYETRLATYPSDPHGETNHELPGMWAPGRGWIDWGGGGWNLLGNPFTSAMNASEFIAGNLADFDPSYQALYVYDGVNAEYLYAGLPVPFYTVDGPSDVNVQAGQGFMVLANNNGVSFDFDKSMQEHGTSLAYLKSSATEDSWPGLQLKVRYGTRESQTTVFYHEGMTAGLDPGYDVGQFSSGPDVEIYTSLAAKDNSVNFARQGLPVEGADKIVIPVGIDSEKGGEVTFSAYTVPIGNYKFWLEDRQTGTFTDLTSKGYTVILPAKTYGTGRFYIISSVNTPTGINHPDAGDSGVRIWTSDSKVIIKGEVSEKARCEVYDINGKMILNQILPDSDLNTVDLPESLRGVFLVRVVDGAFITTRKIALL